MAAASGTDHPPLAPELIARLEKEPFVFRFFQAVRLLEQLQPAREPVGRFARPEKEVARFKAHPSLSFPASEIQALEFSEGKPPQMAVNFMGLTGPLGVLPIWYTNLLRERLKARDTTLGDFLGMFDHRMVSLFFHAWEKYRFAISYERGAREGLTQCLTDIVGLGTAGLQDRQQVPDDSLLFYAGLLSQKPRSAQNLAQLLSDYFDVPVEIEQFVGAWYRLAANNLCRMDERPDYSEQVGLGAVVGDEMWDMHSRARIRIGPLGMERYLEFLPNGSAFQPLKALTRFYSNGEVDFELQLILKKDQVPPCTLGAEGATAPQLGWLTWMKTAPMGRHPGDTILEL
jgi:type VI secretion system protein ImpH